MPTANSQSSTERQTRPSRPGSLANSARSCGRTRPSPMRRAIATLQVRCRLGMHRCAKGWPFRLPHEPRRRPFFQMLGLYPILAARSAISIRWAAKPRTDAQSSRGVLVSWSHSRIRASAGRSGSPLRMENQSPNGVWPITRSCLLGMSSESPSSARGT